MTNKASALIQELEEMGIEVAFLVTGGAAMFLNDALFKSNIKVFAFHHEQAASMAAEAYSRVTQKPSILMVTAGPGAINALNGVFGAFTDSIPLVVISGQARSNTLRSNRNLGKLRQLGDQEADIPKIVESIVKEVAQVKSDTPVRKMAQDFYVSSISDRPGPVWIDFPIDTQNIENQESTPPHVPKSVKETVTDFKQVLVELIQAKRPTLLVGSGVSNEESRINIQRINQHSGIVLQPAWTGIDLVPCEMKNFGGRPSSVGDRAGGMIQKCSDLVIALGTSLSIRQIGFNSQEQFSGRVVHIDIDNAYQEIDREFDYRFIHADPNEFLRVLANSEEFKLNQKHLNWLKRAQRVVSDFQFEKSWFERSENGINPYHLLNLLPSKCMDEAIFACGDASASVIFFQSAALKINQKCFTNAGAASMGYELPAAIGAALADGRQVICIAGDGSLQQNIQELSLIDYYQLPINIIYLDNDGYLSIKDSQEKYFKEKSFVSADTGLPFPDMKYIARANKLKYIRINTIEDFIKLDLHEIVRTFIHLEIDSSIFFHPKAGSIIDEKGRITSLPIYDAIPRLDKEVLSSTLSFLLDETC